MLPLKRSHIYIYRVNTKLKGTRHHVPRRARRSAIKQRLSKVRRSAAECRQLLQSVIGDKCGWEVKASGGGAVYLNRETATLTGWTKYEGLLFFDAFDRVLQFYDELR